MRAPIIIVLLFLLFTPFPGLAKTIDELTFRDTCKIQHDTTISLNFSLDTTKNDFYNLLSFLETKGEFSSFNSENKVDSATSYRIVLKKILCWDKFFDSPVEYWHLNNIFSISYFLVSTKVSKEPLPSFRITQLNFINKMEMDIAATKIQEVHWGEPLLAWNVWFLVKGNNRIYVLENYIPGYTAITEKYRDIIQEEWINKNIR